MLRLAVSSVVDVNSTESRDSPCGTVLDCADSAAGLARSAAFLARLPAWYCASDSGQSTSASVGWVGATSSQPGGLMPRRLPRMAISVLAFISPMPGSASSRASRSLPLSPRSRPGPRRRVSRTMAAAQVLDALGHVAGKRCSAGASGRPRRACPGPSPRSCARRACRCAGAARTGRLKAFWSVTCWSSSKPISSASGSVLEQAIGFVVARERQ